MNKFSKLSIWLSVLGVVSFFLFHFIGDSTSELTPFKTGIVYILLVLSVTSCLMSMIFSFIGFKQQGRMLKKSLGLIIVLTSFLGYVILTILFAGAL